MAVVRKWLYAGALGCCAEPTAQRSVTNAQSRGCEMFIDPNILCCTNTLPDDNACQLDPVQKWSFFSLFFTFFLDIVHRSWTCFWFFFFCFVEHSSVSTSDRSGSVDWQRKNQIFCWLADRYKSQFERWTKAESKNRSVVGKTRARRNEPTEMIKILFFERNWTIPLFL